MKRLLTISISIMLLFIACAACGSNRAETHVTTNNLPEYVSGSIQLDAIEPQYNERAFIPTKRRIYYAIPGRILDFGDPSFMETPQEEKAKEPQEMALVTFIKHYKITREDFETAVEEMRELNNRFGNDMNTEWYELPNADIIYTFDNDIINKYYRRE